MHMDESIIMSNIIDNLLPSWKDLKKIESQEKKVCKFVNGLIKKLIKSYFLMVLKLINLINVFIASFVVMMVS